MELQYRKTCRAQITKLINTSDELLKIKNQLVNVEELTVMVDRIKVAHSNLKQADEKAIPHLKQEKLEEEFECMVEYDDRVAIAKSKLQRRLVCLASEEQCGKSQDAGESRALEQSQSQSSNFVEVPRTSVKLPKLNLKSFNGDLNDYIPFWEQYKTAVHDNNTLDGATKFNYLKTVLTGKALETINGLTPSEACYQDAVEMIQSEYGNHDRIIDSYVQQLLNLTPVRSRTDVLGLRKLYNISTAVTRSLKALGISSNHYGLMVKTIVMKALPFQLKIDFNKQVETETVVIASSSQQSLATSDTRFDKQIELLLKFVKREVDSVEAAQAVTGTPIGVSNEECRPIHKNKHSSYPRTVSGLFTSATENCVFCDCNTHPTIKCHNKDLDIERKRHILKRKSRCYKCTKPNHIARNCKNTYLVCRNCNGKHATVMCDPNFKKRLNEKREDRPNSEPTSSLITNGCFNDVLLQTACAYISATENFNKESFIRIVIDGGSQLTFVKECVSRKLNLRVVGTHRLSIIPFGSSKKGTPGLCNKVEVYLKSQYSKQHIKLNAIEVPEICFDALSMPPMNIRKLKNYELADARISCDEPVNGITMLIGADNYWSIVTGETERITANLTAVNTTLGWTIHGPTPIDSYNVNLNIATVLHANIQEENLNIKEFWDLETIGIKNNFEEKTYDKFTEQFCKENIRINENRYEVALPWKEEENRLDDNYAQAFVRVRNLTRKLIRESKLTEYDNAVRDYLYAGCAEKSPKLQSERKTYFMPHKPVYREDKDTTKIRVVFDASAHAPGFTSLNENLLPGENLVPDLVKILLNFRIGCIAMCADVEKAFLQISLVEKDRDSHSFLWYENKIISANNLPQIVSYRMKRVTFGVTTSPFLLAATIKKHLNGQPKEFQETSLILGNSFYVDDLVIAVNSEEQAKRIYNEANGIMDGAKMNLRKWVSNNQHLTSMFKIEDKGNSSPCPKILGVVWYTSQDQISVNLDQIFNYSNEEKQITKRNVLKTISRIYDPLGILGPYIIIPKILVQRIWKLSLDWDCILPEELQSEWNAWILDLRHLTEFSIPRCVVENSQEQVQLHIFSDASPQAYGVTAYVRRNYRNSFRTNLLMSKNRVAPLRNDGQNELTLPRLELTAATCAARLQKYIISNTKLCIESIYLWTDSKIALYWIKGKAERWKPYVFNRVKEIQSLTKKCTWNHCPGQDNPADLVTRGIKAKKLPESVLWKNGPHWLQSSEENWPQDETSKIEEPENCVLNIQTQQEEKLEPIFDLDNYSSLEKIIRITSYIQRFINNMKRTKEKSTGYLKLNEIQIAEIYWLKHVQNTKFSEEIQLLKKEIPLNKKSSILTLSPFLDSNGLLRLGGRLQESELTYETQHPIILPKLSTWVTRLINQSHEKLHHGGTNTVLADLRTKYWIIRGRQLIKSVLKKCITCKKLRGKPCNVEFAPLPKSRLMKNSRSFEVTGLDFAGPLYVKEKGRSRKIYIMLLTCAVTRAIHLELVEDMSAESCIRSLRRFISRRGVPKIIYSDNAKTFKRVSLELVELNKMLKNKELQSVVLKYRIEWKFIIERAPWWGGFWERMVKTVKDSLKLTIGKAVLNFDELQTILTEVEATVNARPLTYIDSDPNNPWILTPNKFLIGEAESSLTEDIPFKDIQRNSLLEKWKCHERIMNKYWKRWSTDYLQQLRLAHHLNGKKTDLFKEGSILLLNDQNTPRTLWKMVRVINLFHGRDGKVRACEVRLPNGKLLKRPVQLLYPLELDYPEEVVHTSGPEDVENNSQEDVTGN